MDDRVWSLKVDSSIQLQCKQLLQEAEHTIHISLWKEELSDYLPILIEKEQAGVKVEALVVGDVKEQIPLTALYTLSPNQEHQALEKNRLIIIDEETILFAGVEKKHGRRWSQNQNHLLNFLQSFSITTLP